MLTIHATSSDTVDSVKTEIQDEESIIPFRQILMFDGKKLVDGRTLNDYGIQNESTLNMLLSSRAVQQ